jgi:signal transduction histidine kinase
MADKSLADTIRGSYAAILAILVLLAIAGWDALHTRAALEAGQHANAAHARLQYDLIVIVLLGACLALVTIGLIMRLARALGKPAAAAPTLLAEAIPDAGVPGELSPDQVTRHAEEHAAHVFLLDENGTILAINQPLLEFSGTDISGMNYLEVCDISAQRGVEEAKRFAAGMRAVVCGEARAFCDDYICRTPGGDYWYRATVSRMVHGHPPRILVVHENITRHRAMESALRQSALSMRELAGHQEAVREEERKRIAQEIHDDLGQQLLAMKIEVSILQAGLSDMPQVASKLDGMQATISNLVQSVRGIINDLRPAVLDLGLHAAVEWQVNEFRRKTRISCRLASNCQEVVLSDSTATALFRVLQESLSNVSRHSGASHVDVELQVANQVLLMQIADNGEGMLQAPRKPDSFGLRGMRERIGSLGGELTITSMPGQGVTVAASVPLLSQDDRLPEGYVRRSPYDRRASRRLG